MTVLMLGVGISALVMVVYAIAMTDGEYLNQIKVTEVLLQILFGIIGLAFMFAWGGLIGAGIMGGAALIRKLRSAESRDVPNENDVR